MKTTLLGMLMLVSTAIFAQSSTNESTFTRSSTNESQVVQSSTNESQIIRLVDELVLAYNTHNFKTLKENTTDDVGWINIVGMWWKGRNDVVAAHDAIFNTIFKGVKFEKKSVSVRSITDDVMIANLIIHVGEFFPPDGIDHGTNKQNAADDLLTLVYVKKNGRWLLTAGHNTVIDAKAVPPL